MNVGITYIRGVPDLLTSTEVARQLGVTSETVRRWCKAGKVTHLVLPSGQVRFRPADIAAMVATVAANDTDAA